VMRLNNLEKIASKGSVKVLKLHVEVYNSWLEVNKNLKSIIANAVRKIKNIKSSIKVERIGTGTGKTSNLHTLPADIASNQAT